ncbi:MAG: hypothetical protein F7C35_01550 [Desulfurococcales archaeon]|nr:hypothetical protein [Desulfurococcales archaeon]
MRKLLVVILGLTVVGLAAGMGSYFAYKEGLACIPGEEARFPLEDGGVGSYPGSSGLPSVGGEGLFECQKVYGVEGSRILGFHFSELAPVYFMALLAVSFLAFRGAFTLLALRVQLVLYMVGFLLCHISGFLSIGLARYVFTARLCIQL